MLETPGVTYRSVARNTAVVALVIALFPSSLVAQQMVFPDAAWQMAAPESVLMDADRLETALASVANKEELMVVRNGRVIWQGNNIDSEQHVWSVTKSVASTVMGLLVDDGLVSLDTRVTDYLPSMQELYPDATLRHFVTQTSGYVAEGERIPLADPFPLPEQPFDPGTPLFTPAGSQFAYTGVAMDVLANALTRAAQEPLQSLFTRRIAEPIEMDPDRWDWGEFITSDGVVVDGGAGFPGKGFSTSASNAARLGLLYLNRGTWNGQELLSSEWVDEATQVQVPASVPLHPQSATSGPGEYGLGWWVLNNGWYHAIGNENNYISVNPAMEMVVVSLGTESGGNAFYGTHVPFLTRLNAATMPAYWNQAGDGDWDARDPTTGKSRWVTQAGLATDIYPTTSTLIRTDTVRITRDLAIGELSVEGGGLHVVPGARLESTGQIELDAASEFRVEGVLDAQSVHVRGGSSVVLEGTSQFSELRIWDGTVSLSDIGVSVPVRRLRMQEDSQVRFEVSDTSWDSTVLFTRVRPVFSGDLQLDFSDDLNLEEFEGQTINLFDWEDRAQPITEFDQVTVPMRIDADLSQLYSAGDITILSVLDKPLLTGDFNGDNVLDASDIDELAARLRFGTQDSFFDLNDDQLVADEDLSTWVETIGGTYFGDADLNRQVEFDDFLTLSANFGRQGGWSQGDFDADGEVSFADFLILSQNFEKTPTGNARTVPEPSTIPSVVLASILLLSVLRSPSR